MFKTRTTKIVLGKNFTALLNEAPCLWWGRNSNLWPFHLGMFWWRISGLISVESFPRIVLLLLIDHDAHYHTCHTAQNTQEKQEKGLESRHGGRFRIIHVIPWRFKKRRWRIDVGAVFLELLFSGFNLIHLHGDDIVVIRQITWKDGFRYQDLVALYNGHNFNLWWPKLQCSNPWAVWRLWLGDIVSKLGHFLDHDWLEAQKGCFVIDSFFCLDGVLSLTSEHFVLITNS